MCFAIDHNNELTKIVCLHKLTKECPVKECKGKRRYN